MGDFPHSLIQEKLNQELEGITLKQQKYTVYAPEI